jgi:RND family efflux transporter MFP subunit
MNSRSCLCLVFAASVLALAGCSAPAPEPAGPAPTAEVRIAEVRAITLSDHLEAYGDVGYSPKVLRVIDTTAEVIVEQVYASVGQAVAEGTPLLRIRPTSNSLLELNKAAADRVFAQQESDRIARQFARQLATNADRAAAAQALRSAEATWRSAASRVGDGSARDMKAETDGVIASIDVERGDIAPADTALVHLADTGMLQVRLGIEPSDLPRVSAGQSVVLSPVYDRGITLHGTVASVVTQVDPGTRLAEALVDVTTQGDLLPGSTVRATIQVKAGPGVIGIPRAAVLYSGDKPYVFIVANGHAQQTWIQAGQDDGNHVEVLGGLTAGQSVVVEGNYILEDGMAVTVLPPATSP